MQKLQIKEKTIFDSPFWMFLFKQLFSFMFYLYGWKSLSYKVKESGIMVAAPHTSNWDLIWALGSAIITDSKIYFSIKASWCKKPIIGNFMLWLGAMPLERGPKGSGQVKQINEFIKKSNDKVVLFLFTPEGTRGAVDKWKTGFYRVAESTNLPIYLAKTDYKKKESGIFFLYKEKQNIETDVPLIQNLYREICGKFPEKQFPPYEGDYSSLTPLENRIVKVIYKMNNIAKFKELYNKINSTEFSLSILYALCEKKIIQKISTDNNETFQLTPFGLGYILKNGLN